MRTISPLRTGKKHSPHLLYCEVLFRAFVIAAIVSMTAPARAIASETAAKEIYVIDTIARSIGIEFKEAISTSCPSCGPITFTHMGGNMRTGLAIAKDLRAAEKASKLAFVVTLGKPATAIIAKTLKNTDIFYTMVGAPLSNLAAHKNIHAFPTDAPLAVQVRTLIRYAPTTRKIAIISSRKLKVPLLQDEADITLYDINSTRQLPQALRQVAISNDALIFLRDAKVINNDTIQFIVGFTLENQLRTLGYSQALVKAGLSLALVPSPEAFGHHIGVAAESLLSKGEWQSTKRTINDYEIHVNDKVLNHLNGPNNPSGTINGRTPK